MTMKAASGGKRFKRWRKAQRYEQHWWKAESDALDPEYYEVFAGELLRDLNDRLTVDPETRTLEIGSGAAGIVTCLPGQRWAIDPLETFYASVPAFRRFRDPEVRYLQAAGEHLPFRDSLFDLLIMDNVLDHCLQPSRVLWEARRVLKSGGILYLRQHTFHHWGLLVRRVMEAFEIDPGHPFSFTAEMLHRAFRKRGFEILSETHSGHFEHWLADLKSGQLRRVAKAALFTNWDTGLFVLRKRIQG